MFKRILIANRGEIACRIIKTCQALGIQTVAIYSRADKDSLHVLKADAAFCVGEAEAKDSYLNIKAIIAAAIKAEVEAIHPGYGFLSENPLFAKACKEAKLVFIGPPIKAIEIMGSKQLAKQLLEKTKVPLTPGYHGHEQRDERLLAEAKRIGFPILLKAASGGGGRGMRAVYSEHEFKDALAGARRESLASFADDTLLIEKLILDARHVEVQIMADNHGQVVHLFERDCSIQRRHQKIIEEAPAPNVSPSLRERLAEAAKAVAQAIDYRGAGTVEFLVDKEEAFYFMEMNTRLQVEHPVTEMITGLDLVAWQLNIAANEPLPCSQNEIKRQGHAIECRIYAEDPGQDFIPSIGKLHLLREPQGQGIRLDSGVVQGSQISRYYDPLMAKLIAFGETREQACLRLQRALETMVVGGVKTNLAFLQAICSHPQFINAKLTTDFLQHEVIKLPCPDKQLALWMAACYDYLALVKSKTDPLDKACFAWQMHLSSHWQWRYLIEGQEESLVIMPLDDKSFLLQTQENTFTLEGSYLDGELIIAKEGQQYKAFVDNQVQQLGFYFKEGFVLVARFNWQQLNAHPLSKGQLTSPIPATVVAILKKVGEPVKAGDGLIILEAMKMEHTIHAPFTGVLVELFYEVGAQVKEGAQLLALKAGEG